MVYPILSNPHARLTLILWASLAALGLVFGLIALTFIARASTARRHAQRVRIAQTWQPVLLTQLALGRLPQSLPPLLPAEALAFAAYWLEQLNSVEGHAREQLKALARRLALPQYTNRHLNRWHPDSAGRRAVAICVAGHLQERGAVPALQRALRAREATLAFTAALALIRIDAQQHGRAALAEALQRHWAAPYVAKILRELYQKGSLALFHHALQALPPKQVRTLLKAWASVDYQAAEQFSRDVLLQPDSEGWLLCGALEILRNPHDAPLARSYLAHPLWSVRVQAVNALSKFGLHHDIAQLGGLIHDETWWVRERVQQALHLHQLPNHER